MSHQVIAEPTLAQRAWIAMGRLAKRRDVIVDTVALWSGPVGRWNLPEQVSAFYREQNGLAFKWRFRDEAAAEHGPELLGLDNTGAWAVDPRDGRGVCGVVKASGLSIDALPAPWTAEDEVLVLCGAPDAPSLLVRFPQGGQDDDVYAPHGRLGSFRQALEQALASGFAYGWERKSEAAARVSDRLQAPAPLRETFEVEVESARSIDGVAYRRGLLAALPPARFDAMMKAAGSSAKAKGLSPDDRTRHLEEALDGARSARAVTAMIRAAALPRATTRDDLVTHFRLDGRPVVEVEIRVAHLPDPDGLPLAEEPTTLVRILHEQPGLHVTDGFPAHPDLLSFCYLAKLDLHWVPYLACETVERWKGRGAKQARFRLLLDPERAEGLSTGLRFVSSALPSTMQGFRRR